VRYTDSDGDLVTVSISKGGLELQADFIFTQSGLGEQLQRISLSDDGAEFAGASLVVFAQQKASGDGLADVGYIDARGIDLVSVRVSGDLGRIDAGDANGATPGLEFLRIGSLGRLGVSTQAPGAAGLASQIMGDLATLRVDGDIVAASISVGSDAGGVTGSIGSAVIGGSLRGGTAAESGSIHTVGGISSIEILGSIIGGAGENSGSVSAGSQLGSVLIGGSLASGAGAGSGSIRAGERIHTIAINEEVAGSAQRPAIISAAGVPPKNATDETMCMSQFRVGGSVTFAEILGGYDLSAAAVNGDAQIGRITVGGDWVASTAAAGGIAGPDGLFATADDIAKTPNQFAIRSSIQVIAIAGNVRGTAQNTADHFGFVADHIGSVTSGGKAVTLLPGPNNDTDPNAARLAAGTTDDVRILELPAPSPPPSLLSAVSRKEHGAAGAFDIALALSGTASVEPRDGDTLTLIFTFDHDVTGGSATLASGSGILTAPPIFNGRQMTVNLGTIVDQQTLVVQLSDITDTAGGLLPTVTIPVSILVADVNGNRLVNTSDVNVVRAAITGNAVNEATFRADLDLDGIVDQADVDLARANSGHQLP
jgi:hypothetical protein